MSRRNKKRSIEPEVQAALINGQAILASAEIQAKGSRSNALISMVGAVVAALVAGVCGVTNTVVTALPDVLTRPGPATATAGPATATAGPRPIRVPDASDTTRAVWQEQRLAKIEEYAGKVLSEDCLSYSDEDQRRHCWDERLQALGMVRNARAALLDVRGPLGVGVVTIS
ncbi:hypothetical protein [Micromonospora sp. AMSO31t]|uniref:hypothetical protein n=1 Tax=Micromonospora sp. AMSO31t TaxID=2650566 RepID=UPI00124B4601|nr:hypothetical protein [Micromonospora sp. AMSO31t]KAB1912683.1 hypothetical protein F8274_13140 [Micromonospora sp. AMSO31t]